MRRGEGANSVKRRKGAVGAVDAIGEWMQLVQLVTLERVQQ